MKLTAKCPFCDKEHEAEITFPSEFHRQDARRRLDRVMEGHIVRCCKNPHAFQSWPIPKYPVRLQLKDEEGSEVSPAGAKKEQ